MELDVPAAAAAIDPSEGAENGAAENGERVTRGRGSPRGGAKSRLGAQGAGRRPGPKGPRPFTGRLMSKKYLDADRSRTLDCKVFIGGIPWEMDWKELKEIIRQKVENVALANIAEDDEGRSAGIGIAEFNDPESAKKCIELLNGLSVGKRSLSARPITERDMPKFKKLLATRKRDASGKIINRRPQQQGFNAGDPSGLRRSPRGVHLGSLFGPAASTAPPFTFSMPPAAPFGQSFLPPPQAPTPALAPVVPGLGASAGGFAPSMDNIVKVLSQEKVVSESMLSVLGLSANTLRQLGIEFENHLTNQVYVGNLVYTVTERKLREVFSMAGQVMRIRIPEGKDGRPGGYAIITFNSVLEALQAIQQFNNQLLFDRAMRVRIYVPDDLGWNARDHRTPSAGFGGRSPRGAHRN